jgi:4-hydroxy-3-methylbut-2-en-1-yl diphosphate reductase
MALMADLVLVVGAANSSNSNRLREIAAEQGIPSYLIADAGELRAEWLGGVHTVGVTAGASAPEELVQQLIDRLRDFGAVEVESLPGITENVRFRMPSELAEV